MKALFVGSVCAIMVSITSAALAHHSAAGVDQTTSVTDCRRPQGVQVGQSPLVMDIDVTDDKGQTKLWSVG
jgi:hypothetical protein